jgi:hypothetical protein
VLGVRVGKPTTFFRTHPDQNYRRLTEVYVHKIEGVVGETTYIVGPAMRGRILEARPSTLVTYVYRDGVWGLWPIKYPRPGERDNMAWVSARAIARIGLERFTMPVWQGRSYISRDAQPGYAPDPDWSKAPSFEALVSDGFGEHGVINDEDHPVYRELYGITDRHTAGKDISGDDEGEGGEQ